jgi:hypothetical protein
MNVAIFLPALLGMFPEPTPPDFAGEVRPLLAKYCFKCHGPDDATRKGALRLDLRDAAMRPAKSGEKAIVPGHPDQSELIRRLDEDGSAKMPPESTKIVLSPNQKDILKRWVSSGAEYRPHWAFVAPQRPEIPAVKNVPWVKTPIDRFILALLETKGIAPAPAADARTLVRRLSYDLIGLPPDPAWVEEFARDPSDKAYANLVDKLLADPRYGERWARPWLDLARYADTNGYEKDRTRTIWPWRDWVVRSINADLPFDQFTILQLAGDLVPGGGEQGRIATGFHRNTMINEEGGIDPLEFRFHAMTDRVATTGTTWLGLTLGCAQCHTHKYDPVTQAEYYKLMAFLDNAEETNAELLTREQYAQKSKALAEIARLEKELVKAFPGDLEKALESFATREKPNTNAWTVARPSRATSNEPKLRIQPDGSIRADGDTTKNDAYEITFGAHVGGVTGIRLEALPDPGLPAGGPGMTWYEGPLGDFFLAEFAVEWEGKPVKFVRTSQTFANAWLGGGSSDASRAIDGDLQTGWAANGKQGNRSVAVFVPEKPLPPAKSWTLRINFGRHYAASLGKFRISTTCDEGKVEARETTPEAERAILAWPNSKADDRQALVDYFVRIAPELDKERKQIDELKKSIPAGPATLVMKERALDNPRTTRIRHRGEYLNPKDAVSAGLPGFLPGMPSGLKADRLGFAQWLVSPDNPLTARVVVNRHWAALMGQGIVRTVDDFGLQGELPSHPALLDWLATEFVREGWSLKKLHRLIVTSAVYRQSSYLRPELATIDAENRLCARGPRHRLDAEMIRDGALEAAGILSKKMGGPGVYPPQPSSVTTDGTYGALAWVPSTGEDRFRRSLYTFAKRTAPFAMAQTFDAPSGEACTAKRDRSNTPLQALNLLNDPAQLEASRALAHLLIKASPKPEERLDQAFQRILSRSPNREESSALLEFVQGRTTDFLAKPAQAKALLGLSEKDSRPNSALAEEAAWTSMARLLFNLDETLVKR